MFHIVCEEMLMFFERILTGKKKGPPHKEVDLSWLLLAGFGTPGTLEITVELAEAKGV